MDDDFVTITLSEFEYDTLLEHVESLEISSGMSKFYQKLLDAVEERELEEADSEEE